ncbi:MAG: hypothetical protein LWX83_16805, partial [Anaerolineae bacterium]|nr:hypothetical protein [Anaerolineae bacterium]
FDMITHFFPFIYIKDHLEWGLPGELFSPEKLLLDAWRNLKIGGLYLIVNQGDQEYQKQKEMLTNIGAQIKVSFCMQSPLYRYDNEHYIMAAVKNE